MAQVTLVLHVSAILLFARSASAASVQYGQQKPAGPSQTIPGLPRMPFAHNKKLFSDLQEKIANLDQYDVERLARRLCDIMDRPSKIAFSELVESVRLIPAEPWQLLGGPWLVKDSAVCEWFWSNPAWEAMTQAGPDGEKLFVPHQIRSVHRAVKQCPVGGVIHVSEGLYRWDGSIKIRSGLKQESLDGGIHISGRDSPVLMGQWLLGLGSAGSVRSVGLAANLSHEFESLLDIHSGPWKFERCECRSVKGQVVNVCKLGEADFNGCTLAGMGAEENLRASVGAFVTDWGSVRFELCSFSSFGLLDIGLQEEDPSHEEEEFGRSNSEEEEHVDRDFNEKLGSKNDSQAEVFDKLKLGFGLFIDGDGHVHCVNSSFSDCHIGVVLMANSSAVVAQSTFFKDVTFGAFYVDELANSSLCIMNSRGFGQTWAGPYRPKFLNDYLFEGFKIVIPPFVPADDQQRMAYYKMERVMEKQGKRCLTLSWQEVERSKGKFRNTFDRDKLVQTDPSLFPSSDEHKYVYDVREAAPINTKLYPESKDGLIVLPKVFKGLSHKPIALSVDPRKFRDPLPGEYCYNCGREGHIMMWCPEGQRPYTLQAVPVIDPCFAEMVGITEELKRRQNFRAQRRREYMAHNRREAEEAVKQIYCLPEFIEWNGNITHDGRLPKVRQNKLDGNIEWYNSTSKKWTCLKVPWFGLPVKTGYVLPNGDEYVSQEDLVYFNMVRKKDGLKPLRIEEWRDEYPRLREVYQEHSDSEDDFRWLVPPQAFNWTFWEMLPALYDEAIKGEFRI